MLRACRRLLRDGGRIAYTTIVVAPGLGSAERREAVRIGPSAVAARGPDAELMDKARFTDVVVTDVTDGFLATCRAWWREFSRHEDAVKETLGEAEWEERQTSRAEMVRGIREGLLKRLLVSGAAGRAGAS